MEQVLYKLPDGWEWKSLGDLVEFKNGYAFKSNLFSDIGVPVLRISNIQSGGISERNMAYIPPEKLDIKTTDFYVEPGDIVIAMSGATTGKVATNNTEDRLLQNQRVGRFIITDKIFRKYVLYYLGNKVEENLQKSLGAAQPNLSTAQIKEIKIPIQPASEQKRIVEKLDTLLTRIDTAIEHLQESVTLADALSQNGLDVYFAELTKTNPELPLLKLADFISGYAFKSGDFTSESGIKPIKITNVGVNEFSENAEEFLPASYESEYQRFAAKANDIVIALTRPIINGGLKVCRVPESYSGALVNQRVAAITSHNKHVLDFIYLYLQSSRTKNYVLEKSKSLNQPNLSITDLKNLTLPLPANDEAIAKAVADCNALISKARKSKAEISEKITMMQQLKASILDSAFKGEL